MLMAFVSFDFLVILNVMTVDWLFMMDDYVASRE